MMMTREQMELLCANTLRICMGNWTSEMDILLTHDQAQRAEIERQAKELETLREALRLALNRAIELARHVPEDLLSS